MMLARDSVGVAFLVAHVLNGRGNGRQVGVVPLFCLGHCWSERRPALLQTLHGLGKEVQAVVVESD